LEENYHANGCFIDKSIATLRKLNSLRGLRHIVKALSIEEAVPTEASVWDWNKLLEDTDDLLTRIDVCAHMNSNGKINVKIDQNDTHGLQVSYFYKICIYALLFDGFVVIVKFC